MLSGDNGILKRAVDAKELTGIGQEKEFVVVAYNSALTKKISDGDSTAVTAEDLNLELINQGATADGSNPIKVTFTDSKRQYTINTNGIIEYAGTTEQEIDYQWKIVSDNDNNGVISIGDEVAPLIDSVENEHFFVFHNNGDSVQMIVKKAVDYVTNSQSSSASGVTFDMAYCDLDEEEHDLIMPEGAFKGVEYSYDEFGNPDPSSAYNAYYNEGEIGKLHCTGTYTKNYALRLKQAGLDLMDFNSNSGCSYMRLPKKDDWVGDSEIGMSGNALFIELRNDVYWLGEIDDSGKVMCQEIPDTHLKMWFDSYSLRPVIQVDINLIRTTNN